MGPTIRGGIGANEAIELARHGIGANEAIGGVLALGPSMLRVAKLDAMAASMRAAEDRDPSDRKPPGWTLVSREERIDPAPFF
jgi:hypothetical protein